MPVATDRPLATQADDTLDVQLLFSEARAHRRRLRFTIALFVAVGVVVGAIAIATSGVIGHRNTQATSTSTGPVLNSREHLTSVQFTETREVAAPKQALLFDSLPLVKLVVDTTLGPSAPSVETQRYYTSWTRHPRIYTSPAGFEQNGMLFVPNPSARLQICTNTAAGTKCSDTTKRWIEEQPAQLRSAATAAETAPRYIYDPTKLFGELRATVKSLVRVGTSKIGGFATTEYRGSIPAQNGKELRSAPPAEQTVLDLAVPGADETLYGGEHGGQPQWSITVNFKSVPFEVWVDAQGIVRQIRVATSSIGFKLEDQHEDQVVPLTVTLDYSNFGKPVAPASVPARDVFVVQGTIVSERSVTVQPRAS